MIKGVVMTQFKEDDRQQENICFVYAGQGPQWWKMGRELYSSEPIFRQWIDKISSELEKLTTDWKLVHELIETEDEKTSRIDDTNVAQPCIFALQVALTALWLSWGVRPKVIVGHSVGEIAAAYVSGHLTLEEAVRVIFHRSRLQHRNTRQNGLMLALTGLTVTEAQAYLEGIEDRVSIAAISSPTSLTLSGDATSLQELYEVLIELKPKIMKTWLRIENAFHCPQMEKFNIREDLLECLKDVRGEHSTGEAKVFDESCAQAKLYSTVTGTCEKVTFDAQYWWKNVRNTVQFSRAMEGILRDTDYPVNMFLEISPHPVLANSIQECTESFKRATMSAPPSILHSLKRKKSEEETLLFSLCQLPIVNWSTFWHTRSYKDIGTRLSSHLEDFPLYSFNNQTCWFETKQSVVMRRRHQPVGHPLLGCRVWTNEKFVAVWKNYLNLSLSQFTYLRDHSIKGQILFPATGFIELVLAAFDELHAISVEDSGITLENVEFMRPLILSDERSTEIHTVLLNNSHQCFIYSRSSDETTTTARSGGIASSDLIADYSDSQLLNEYSANQWTLHSQCTITQLKKTDYSSLYNVKTIEQTFHSFGSKCTDKKTDSLYRYLANRGYQYGPTFRCVETFHYSSDKDECYSKLLLPTSLSLHSNAYFRHPAVNDASLHTVIGFTPGYDTYVPTSVKHVFLPSTAGKMPPLNEQQILVYVLRDSLASDPSSVFDIVLVDALSTQIMSVWKNLEVKPYLIGDAKHNIGLFERLKEAVVVPLSMQLATRALLREEIVKNYCFKTQWILSETETAVKRQSETTELFASSIDWEQAITMSAHESELKLQYDQAAEQIQQYILLYLRRTFDIVVGKEELVFSQFESLNNSLRERIADIPEVPSQSQHHLHLELLKLLNSFPILNPIISILNSCCENLNDVITGNINPLQILFNVENKSKLKQFYSLMSESQTKAIFTALTDQLMIMEKKRSGVLTILEVGAGTGTATQFALEILLNFAIFTDTEIEYVFTDVSSAFFVDAQKELSTLVHDRNAKNLLRLTYSVLDIEDDNSNKLGAESFDLIFASLVVHVATDLVKSLRNLRRLLRPNGLFFLIENTTPTVNHDIIFGLLPQWWQQQKTGGDDIRKTTRRTTATESEWTSAFRCAGGFHHPIQCATDKTETSGISTLIAQKQDFSEQQWIIFVDESNGIGLQVATKLRDTYKIPNITLVWRQQQVCSWPPTLFDTVIIQQLETDLAEYFVKLSSLRTQTAFNVVYAWSLHSTEVEKDNEFSCLAFMSLLHAIDSSALSPCIYVLTNNVHSRKPNLSQSSLVGLTRTAIREYAKNRMKLIDLQCQCNTSASLNLIDRLVHELIKFKSFALDEGDEEFLLKENKSDGSVAKFVRRYESYDTADERFAGSTGFLYTHSVSNHGTIVISGGLGGLGLALSQWMIRERNVKRMVLLSRRTIHDLAKSSTELQAWTKLQETAQEFNAHAELAQVDVTDRSEVLCLFQRINSVTPDFPVRGIFHLAMVLHDCLIQNMTPEILCKSMQPKVQGAWNLHQASLQTRSPIDFFVMFSSIRNHVNDVGSSNYNAGNNFLDSLATYRQQQNLPALSVSVPGISDAGYVNQNQRLIDTDRLSDEGYEFLEAHYLFELIERFHGSQNDIPCPIVLTVNWEKLNRDHLRMGLQSLVCRQIPSDQLSTTVNNTSATIDLDSNTLRLEIQMAVAKLFGSSDVEKVDVHRSLIKQGLDSLMAVSLSHWMNGKYCDSRVVMASDFLQGLSISEAAHRIQQQQQRQQQQQTVQVSSSETKPSTSENTMQLSQVSNDYSGTSLIVPFTASCNDASRGVIVFCVSDVLGIGTVSPYAVDHLKQRDSNIQLVIFRSCGYDSVLLLTTVEQIAEEYICQMKRYQPYGPYTLLGSTCFGCLIVTEMVHQLATQHKNALVERLLLFDPNDLGCTPLITSCSLSKNYKSLLQSIHHSTVIYNSLFPEISHTFYDPKTVGREKELVLRSIQKQMTTTILDSTQLTKDITLAAGKREVFFKRMLNVVETNSTAQKNYLKQQKLFGFTTTQTKVLLFERSASDRKNALDWYQLFSNIRTINVIHP